jgi:hypothetical protein
MSPTRRQRMSLPSVAKEGDAALGRRLGAGDQVLPQLPGDRPELVPAGLLGEVQAGGDGAAGAADHVERRVVGLLARQGREETAGPPGVVGPLEDLRQPDGHPGDPHPAAVEAEQIGEVIASGQSVLQPPAGCPAHLRLPGGAVELP